MILNTLKHLCLITLICCTARVYALPSDRNQPVKITADSATANRETGVSIFRGKVKITQGTTVIIGDRVTVHTDQNRKVTAIIAAGDPRHMAQYQTVPKLRQQPFHASAITIKYYPQKGIAYLMDHAIAYQDKNKFTGPLLTYDTQHQIVRSSASKQGRTTIVIYPKTVS